jgi:hypothetical protein
MASSTAAVKPMTMAELEQRAAGEQRDGVTGTAAVASNWLEGIRSWQREKSIAKRRTQLQEDARAAERDRLARQQSEHFAARSQRLLEGMAELEGLRAAEEAAAAVAGGTSRATSSRCSESEEGGDTDGASRGTARRIPRPPSAPPRRTTADSAPGSARQTPLGPPAVVLSRPTDLEPIQTDWVPPTANADASAAAAKQATGDYAGAVRSWGDVLKACAAQSQPAAVALATLLSNRAATLLLAGCYDAAASDCSRALEICSGHVLATARLARCHLILGQYARAKQLLVSVPKSRWPYDLAGDIAAADTLSQFVVYLDHGNFAAALDAVSRVCGCVAGGEVAFEVMRLETLGIVAPDDVLDDAAAAADQHPRSPELRYWHALFTFRSDAKGGRAGDALREMLEAEKLCVAVTVAPLERSGAGGFALGAPRAIAPRRLGDIRRAKEALMAVAPIATTIHSALLSSRWAQCVQACNGAMQTDLLGHRKLRSYVLLCRARALLAQYQAVKAASDCTDGLLVVDSPFLPDLFATRSEAYAAMCDWGRAWHDAREAYRMNPTSASFDRVESMRAAAEREEEARRRAEAPPTASSEPPTAHGAGGQQQQPRPSQQARPSTAGPRRSSFPRFADPAGTGSTRGAASDVVSAPSAPPTHYTTLGIPRDADGKTIARAYRDLALVWHPDRWSGKPAPQLREAETKFKLISNAYQVLAEAAARAAYDRTLPRM